MTITCIFDLASGFNTFSGRFAALASLGPKSESSSRFKLHPFLPDGLLCTYNIMSALALPSSPSRQSRSRRHPPAPRPPHEEDLELIETNLRTVTSSVGRYIHPDTFICDRCAPRPAQTTTPLHNSPVPMHIAGSATAAVQPLNPQSPRTPMPSVHLRRARSSSSPGLKAFLYGHGASVHGARLRASSGPRRNNKGSKANGISAMAAPSVRCTAPYRKRKTGSQR